MPHSPGPWEFVEGDKERQAMSDINKQGDPEFRIAYVICEAKNETQRAEDIANARLIAAAPELLAALEAICDSGCSLSDALTDAMLSAIAKAKGK